MNKKTLILGGVLIVLVAMTFIYQGPLKSWQANLGKTKNFLAGIKIDQIDKIEITRNGQTVSLEKQANTNTGSSQAKWKIGETKDFYADTAQISLALDNLGQAISGNMDIISDNADRQKEFNADSSGVEVKLYNGSKKLADFYVGKLANDYSSTYIANVAGPATYSVKVNLNSVFNQADWRDLTIFSSAKDQLTKIRMQYPDREFTMEKKGDSWIGILPSGFNVNQNKVDKILTIMSNLTAAAIPEQTFTGTGLDKHLIIVEASGQGIDNVLMIGQANKASQYFAKKGDSDNIYLITNEQRDQLNQWIWQLK